MELRGFALSKTSLYSRSWFNMVSIFCYTVCYTVGRGSVPLWLAHLAWPMPVLDRLLAGVVIDRILWRYLLRPVAGDAMERFLVDAGHVLRSGQDCGRQKENCEDRESKTLTHGGLLFMLVPI